MFSTFSPSNSPEKKINKWLAKPDEKEQKKELGAILSYNSPTSPIRPYPTQLTGID